jgi:hypothetical protein
MLCTRILTVSPIISEGEILAIACFTRFSSEVQEHSGHYPLHRVWLEGH